jgi:hypothetical protein
MPRFFANRIFALCAGLLALAPLSLFAQLPATQLLAISPPGGKQGTTVELKIAAGADTDGVDRLHFSHPGIKAAPKMGDAPIYGGTAQPLAGQFTVTIAADVPPGIYDVRAAGTFGMSNPRAFVVGDQPEVNEEATNNSPDKAMKVTLGTVVNGAAAPQQTDYFRIAATKGQRVIVDSWAQRIDSRMDTTLAVYDATGRELARDRDTNRRDAFVDFVVPVDGEYVIAIWDFVYTGGPEYFYRLAIHTGPYIDFILPPAGLAGTTSKYTVYGRNLPGGTPAEGVSLNGRLLDKAVVDIALPAKDVAAKLPIGTYVGSQESPLDEFEYRLKGPQGASNPYLLGFASAPVVAEKEPNQSPLKAQKITVPCEFVGQFYPAGDVDWLEFDAKNGAVYYIEVISQRLGLATDPSVVLQRVTKNSKGEEQVADITELDDDAKDLLGPAFPSASGDASYRFQVPDDGAYRILVRDLYGAKSDPRRVYRLSIREPQPDFRLVAAAAYPTATKEVKPWSPHVRRGDSEPIEVLAFRQDGFDGEIEVSVEGLPAGVTCSGTTIGPGQDTAAIVLTAADNAAAWAGTIQVVGKSKINNQDVARQARSGASIWPLALQNNQPTGVPQSRATRELALSVSAAETLPVAVEVGPGAKWEMSRAGKLEIPVKVTRRDGFKEQLVLAVTGLPAAYKVPNLTIAGNANEGKLVVDIPPTAPLGTLSFYLKSPAKVSYKRDVAAADKAAAEKKDMDKLAADLAAAVKTAEKAKQDADKALADATAAMKAAAADKKAEAEAKLKAATDQKAAADKALADANAKAKAATDAKTAADKRATDLANAAKPKDANTVVTSSVARFTVTAAPVKVAVTPAPVKKGAQVEIPVAITRLYNYAEPVDLEAVLPGNLKDVKVTAAQVAKGQNDGKLVVAAGPNAAPGQYTVTLRAKPKFNNQALQVEETFALKVE